MSERTYMSTLVNLLKVKDEQIIHWKNAHSHYKSIRLELYARVNELESLLKCRVCHTSKPLVMYLPCKHMTTCDFCTNLFAKCVICGVQIDEKVIPAAAVKVRQVKLCLLITSWKI